MHINEAIKWYTENRSTYKALSIKTSQIIKDVMDNEKIEYYSITCRAKKIDSFTKKVKNEKYEVPDDITDLAGIRVITYVESEAIKAADILKNVFDIDIEKSIDKSSVLGVDKVGYRSQHYVASFSSDRSKLPEFKKFYGLKFEVQIRTILEHAWAEIEHDRNYKYTGVLPDKIKRRFAILAGVLELADREFDSISLAIDSYKKLVSERTKSGDLDIKINTTALREFLKDKFKNAINKGLEPDFADFEDGIIDELNKFGIKTLGELEKIIPDDLEMKISDFSDENFISLIRDLMIINDAGRYFNDIWPGWKFRSNIDPILNSYGIDIDELIMNFME
jgi:putative GTP pyrophosphokinase